MLLASHPGHVLWTEDLAVGDIAASEFSARRVWTQLVVAHAVKTGLASADEYLAASAKLLGLDYRATVFNPLVLVKAGSMSNWDADKWPFNKALEQFTTLPGPDEQVLAFAAVLIAESYKASILLETRQGTLIKILEWVSRRKMGLVLVRVLLTLLPRTFGVNVLAADEAKEIGLAWLDEAERRPRFEVL
jgi:hypothetical protein